MSSFTSNRSAFTATFAASGALDGAEGCFIDGGAVGPDAGFGDDPAVDGAGNLVDSAGGQRVGEHLMVHGVGGGCEGVGESVGIAEVVADFAVGPGAC